jgi:tRNA(Glu) U13 pseudouridine synthase TruD
VEKPRNVSHELIWYQKPNTTLQHFPPFCQVNADEVHKEELKDGRKALIINFDLPSGTYATMALRELLHSDLGKEKQKELSLKLRAE